MKQTLTATMCAAAFALAFSPLAARADDEHHAPAVVVGPGHGPGIVVGPGGVRVREGHHGDEHHPTVIEEHGVRSHHGDRDHDH